MAARGSVPCTVALAMSEQGPCSPSHLPRGVWSLWAEGPAGVVSGQAGRQVQRREVARAGGHPQLEPRGQGRMAFQTGLSPDPAHLVSSLPGCTSHPASPTKHLPQLSHLQGLLLPLWPCLSHSWGSWGAGGGWRPCPGPAPEWAACLHGLSTRPGRERRDNGPSQLLFPQGGASLAPAPPARAGGPLRLAGSSCRLRPLPQAHLLRPPFVHARRLIYWAYFPSHQPSIIPPGWL